MSSPKDLIQQAEKLARPQTGLLSFLGGSSSYKLEEATDLRVQAANAYRLSKDFALAGEQFTKAADLQRGLGNHNDSANHLVDAYKCYKDVDPPRAIDALSRAIHIFLTQNGQFRRAANFQMDLAGLHETVGDLPAAAAAYEKAGDYFSTDHAEALANKAYLKCADLAALQGEYQQAQKLYDTVIKALVGNNLSRWNLKDYFFKNLLCTLCLEDVVEAQKRLDLYADEEPSWPTTREYKLVADILELIQNGDVQAFSDRVYEFDQFSKLDKLKTQLLLRVKNSVVEKDDDDLT